MQIRSGGWTMAEPPAGSFFEIMRKNSRKRPRRKLWVGHLLALNLPESTVSTDETQGEKQTNAKNTQTNGFRVS